MNSDNDVPFTIRRAAPGDEGSIVALLRELAEYEKAPFFTLCESDVARDLLGPAHSALCHLLFVDGEAVAVSVALRTYRSFRAARGLYVEDLYVRPAHRGRGLGKALLANLAAMAHADGGFLEWLVLDWNAPAITFYESLGARPVTEWTGYRLEGAALERLAS
jgi:GNAT superfamily N-acetyltransferase